MNQLDYEETYGEWPDDSMPTVISAAERMRRAEQVADRHFRRQSPEFVEWLSDGRYPWDFLAQLVVYTASPEAHRNQIARGMADTVKDDWRCYVCNFPGELETEIRQEP